MGMLNIRRCLRLVFVPALIFLTLALPLRAQSPEETAIADQITSQAMDFLSALLGPGKARVTVSVSGELRHSRSSTSLFIPTQTPQEASPKKTKEPPSFMPGYGQRLLPEGLKAPQGFTNYAQGSPPPPPSEETTTAPTNSLSPVRESRDDSNVSEGFVIKKLLVSVVIDLSVPDQKAKEAERLLPSVLHLDPARGDQLSILRADLVPPWKSALQNFIASPKAAGTLLILLGALVLMLIFGSILYITAMRVVKTFVSELAEARRAQNTASALADSNTAGALEKSRITEILPGGIPSLSGEISPIGLEAEPPAALGQRFDFLSSKSPQDLTPLLLPEPAEDIALLLASLAGVNPEIAAGIFAVFPVQKQKEVSQLLLGINRTDPEKLDALESKLRNLVEFGVRGPERLGKILSRLPAEERKSVVSGLTPQNPEAASELEESLFSFEDLYNLKESDLRRVIMGTNYQEWGMALRGAPQILIDAILKQIPEGARDAAREAMESPQPRAKVIEIRSNLLSRAQVLADRGEIVIGEKGASELI